MRKLPLLFLLFIGLFVYLYIGLFNHSYAATKYFDTGYDVVYTISDDGMTHVSINGTLTNTTSLVYATMYNIDFNFTTIQNLTASDKKGELVPRMKKSKNGIHVTLPFKDKVAGIGKSMQFSMSFDTPDIAKEQGNIWEVTIPEMNNQTTFTQLNVKVNVPPTFGPPSIIKPHITNSDLLFTKNDLGNSGISISFGTKQAYTFRLIYHLKNTNVFPVKTEVALPPQTNYQVVVLQKLNPVPKNVVLDSDNNWIAQYYLLPSQQVDVTADGIITVSDQPTKELLTDQERTQDLQSQPYWDVTNPLILQKAKSLKTPEAIYNFVVETLHYDFNRINKNEPRLGAATVLQNPSSAVCLEFTDLFIALSRAAGIPAREVDGYAYTQNTTERPLSFVKDILHAWPEYYDSEKQIWIMVDPTWGNTTHNIDYFHQLDFDHVAFVIKGAESTYPIPAGVYKSSDDENKKDINMKFSAIIDPPQEQISFTPIVETKYFAGLPMGGQIQIKNTGEVLMQPREMLLTSDNLQPALQHIDLPSVPPYGIVDQTFTFQRLSFLTNATYPFTIQLAGHTMTDYIVATPFVLTKEVIIGGLFVVLFTIIIFIVARKAGRVHVSR